MKKMILWKTLLSAAAAFVLGGCWFTTNAPLTEKQEALVKAVRSPDPRVKLDPYLEAVGNRVNFQLPSNGRTPLMLTVILKDMTKMEQLLKAGADPSVQDKKGLSALHYAAGIPDTFYLKRLLDAGAEVDAVDQYKKTPLMEACRMGNKKAVELLLKAGANPHLKDKNGRTIMMFSAGAKQGSYLLVKYLLENNISPMHITKAESIPLTCAIDAHNTETAMFLLKHYPEDVNVSGVTQFAGMLAMRQAIRANDTVVVKELIRRKLPLNNEVTIIRKSLESAHLENWIETFSRAGFIRDRVVPLSWAAMEDNETMIQILLDAGADPTFCDNLGNLPIDYTHAYGSKKLLERAMKKYTRGK